MSNEITQSCKFSKCEILKFSIFILTILSTGHLSCGGNMSPNLITHEILLCATNRSDFVICRPSFNFVMNCILTHSGKWKSNLFIRCSHSFIHKLRVPVHILGIDPLLLHSSISSPLSIILFLFFL